MNRYDDGTCQFKYVGTFGDEAALGLDWRSIDLSISVGVV